MAVFPFLSVLVFTTLASYCSNIWTLAIDADGPVESLTVQFTRYYPRQIPPTSTVYGAIVTNILKVVDCDYVQVENIDHNSPQEGQYFYRTTVPVLTRYHVTCMDASTIITRQAEATVAAMRPSDEPTVLHQEKRGSDEVATSNILYELAEHLSTGIDPTNENITLREFRYLQQINSALFALNIVNSGLNLTLMCQYLQDPTVTNNLEQTYINPKQATNIVCFASVYGLFLGQSNDQVLADLATLEFAVQMHAYQSQSLNEICQRLSYSAVQKLGIDAEGIQKNVCNGTAGISQSPSLPSISTATNASATGSMTSFNLPFPTGTLGTAWTSEGTGISWNPILSTPSAGTSLSMGVSQTVSMTGIWNTTVPSATDIPLSAGSSQSTWLINTGSSIIYGTGGSVFSSATSAAGSVAPWFNATAIPTAGTAPISSSGQAMPTSSFTQEPSFYMPPRLIRDRLRRHGRD